MESKQGADHNTMKYTFETELETIPLHKPWSKADWKLFRDELENKEIYLPNTIMPPRHEKKLDQYYKQIEKALNKACPKQKEIIMNKNNPWHKGTLKQLRLKKSARYKEYKKDTATKTRYYKTLAKYRKMCRQKQKKHERD